MYTDDDNDDDKDVDSMSGTTWMGKNIPNTRALARTQTKTNITLRMTFATPEKKIK